MKYESIILEIKKVAETNIENDYRPQNRAIRMLSNFNNKEAIKILEKLSEHPSHYVNEQAQEALQKIKKNKNKEGNEN